MEHKEMKLTAQKRLENLLKENEQLRVLIDAKDEIIEDYAIEVEEANKFKAALKNFLN